MRLRLDFTAVTVVGVVLVGCAAPPPRTVEGECAEFHGGNVCSWATLDSADSLLAFGATVPLATIEQAPPDLPMVWPPLLGAMVRMPAQVTTAMGIDHVTIYWEPHGHPPGPYLTPHFDFHFYNVSSEVREAIDCIDMPKPTRLPEGYGLVDVEIPDVGLLEGLCVPDMGMHALLESEMNSDEIFEGTMVVGYDSGTPLFFEPMISREMLVRRESFELPMPEVSGLPDGVRYPTHYEAEYDEAADAYRFTFTGG